MKKMTAFILAALMVCAVFTGCAPQKTEEPLDKTVAADMQYILDKGEIIVGLDDTFAPMGFRDEKGELVGFDVDFANAVGVVLGLNVKFQPIDWDAKEMELNGKKIDLLWNGLSATPARKESMFLTEPYLNNTLVIMTAKGSEITKKADLAGKKIATQAGSAGLEAIVADEMYDRVKDDLSEYKSYDEALMDLEIGRVDAVIIDKVLGMYKASKKADAFAFASEDFGEDLYAVGMRKEDKAFGASVQQAIKAVIESGKATEISTKWFGEDIVIK